MNNYIKTSEEFINRIDNEDNGWESRIVEKLKIRKGMTYGRRTKKEDESTR